MFFQGGRWTASVSSAGSAARRIEAETKPECIYNICENLLGTPPSFNNFIKWYSYPLNHTETSRMTSSLEHILELLPLQNHIDRQLFTNRVPIVLEVPGVQILVFTFFLSNIFNSNRSVIFILKFTAAILQQHTFLSGAERRGWDVWRFVHTCDCIETVFLRLLSQVPYVHRIINLSYIFRRLLDEKNRHFLCRLLLVSKKMRAGRL